MKTNELIYRPVQPKSFLADHANKAGIQLILSLNLQSLNLFLIKKTVQTVSGWRVLLDCSGFLESCLCFIVWERGELHPWPRTRTAGFLWAQSVPPLGSRYRGQEGIGFTAPWSGWTQRVEITSWAIEEQETRDSSSSFPMSNPKKGGYYSVPHSHQKAVQELIKTRPGVHFLLTCPIAAWLHPKICIYGGGLF